MMKLGRLQSSISPSEMYDVRKLVTNLPPRSWEWECVTYLNQGLLSACVGFSWMHFLSAQPEHVPGIQYSHAVDTYYLARKLDQYPGENYEGSSILGGVRAVQQMFPKAFESYHWAFNVNDLILTVGYIGPVVIGVNWYSDMFNPDDIGVIKASGANVGGHAILIVGVEIFNKMFKLHNSWGEGWGNKGCCWISFDDMERLLKENGEACVATGKHSFGVV